MGKSAVDRDVKTLVGVVTEINEKKLEGPVYIELEGGIEATDDAVNAAMEKVMTELNKKR